MKWKTPLGWKRLLGLLLIQSVLIPGAVYAQEKKPREEKEEKEKERAKKADPVKTHIEFSLDTIMQRLDNMHLTLNRINDFQDHGFNISKVAERLPEIHNNLQTIENNLSMNNSVPEIKNLQSFGVMLNDMQDQLESWRASLFKYNNDLINMNAEIRAFTQDSVIHQLVKDSTYRKMYTDEVRELTQKWEAAGKSTHNNLSKINQLQSVVSEEYFQTIDMESRVADLKKELSQKLFSKEYRYLWEPADSVESGGRTRELAARSYMGQQGIMQYFIEQNWDTYLYILAIGLLFYFWVWRNFRIIRKGPDPQRRDGQPPVGQAQVTGQQPLAGQEQLAGQPPPADLHLKYLHRMPLLSTLVVILNIIPFFDLDAPAIYTRLIEFFLLIVLSVLFWRRWPARYFFYWIGIVVLYLLFSATGAVLVPMMNVRLWLLLLNILSASLGFIAIRRIIRHFDFPRVVKIVSIIFLALNILAALCNLFGRLSLAKIFSTSAIFGLVQIIGLSVFIECLLEILTLQAAVAKTRNVPNKPAVIYEKMQKGLFRLLMVFSIFTWLVVFCINLNAYDPVYDMLSDWLSASKTIGSINFKLGNVFIFIGIIYFSNLLQKYVGYLFGAGDEHAMPEGGKKGSRLVMTRLILIICGFLFAVGASGLPVDKITIVLGALGVGIGLGLQNIVNNLVSGIILIFEHPFQIGDYIELNGKKGIVRDIGIRSSRMVTEEGTEIIMPNGDLLSGEVVNWTVRSNQVRIEVPVSVESGHSFQEIDEIVQGALAGHKDLSGENKPRVLLNTVSEKTMSFTVLVWVANFSQIQTIKSEVLSILYQQLKEKGIKTL